MHITQKSAQNIVNEMKASIHRDINIMDENGVILASTDPARRGKLHQGALAIIREGLDCLTVRQVSSASPGSRRRWPYSARSSAT